MQKIQDLRRNTFFYEETGSTNEDAKKLAGQGALNGTLVVADRQTAGRGRRGRSWISSQGEAIYMSLLLYPECQPNQASMLTLVMALAVLEAIEEIAPGSSCIKWPNDIVMNGRKVCGILTEMSVAEHKIGYVIIGVGVNVNQGSFEETIADTATSLFLELGKKIDRAEFICRVMYFFEQAYAEFEKTWDLSGLKERYQQFLVNRNRQVRVLEPKGEFEGTALGINDFGELLVKTRDKEVVTVYAGEVSVRGIYGYV